uniref:Urocanate hydratase 1 n=1 Tax=Gadus morhua TaxID=8049 RepID=A0A8C5AVZ1_GADMO
PPIPKPLPSQVKPGPPSFWMTVRLKRTTGALGQDVDSRGDLQRSACGAVTGEPRQKPRPTPRPNPDTPPHSSRGLALRNALRYFPPCHHATLAPEFAQELRQHGHIYMYRFCPPMRIKAYPIHQYPCRTPQAAAIMLMIMNNLDPAVAQFPQELVTYGGNGQVFSNWAQFRLVMHYLSVMTEEQTLVLYSGHPMGLFPSLPSSPRAIITNGMVIPNYSSREQYEKMFALGVSMYGQMTAGSYCYIGPQGIVHGTMLTLLNAGRRYLGSGDLRGRVLVTSGLGGMSGAQAKAAVIAGCIGVVAEVDEAPIRKRHEQGWLMEMSSSLDHCIQRIREARAAKLPLSLGYHGNIVDLCLKRHVAAIDTLAEAGMFFWDYGNAFLLEAQRAAKEEGSGGATEFRYPSYVQHIMGDIFSLGFGPFRWVCTSCDPKDLEVTDQIAATVLEEIAVGVSEGVRQQYHDNIRWIREAGKHQMVVGSMARILYSDQKGRVCIALAINKAIADGRVSAPVVISRDHHDVSGTDSPFRETSNVYDGSAFCADMAVQNFVGDAFRGATWVSLHNGGGVGWGEVMNGGFGLVLDGSEEAAKRASLMLNWDVSNGVRRCRGRPQWELGGGGPQGRTTWSTGSEGVHLLGRPGSEGLTGSDESSSWGLRVNMQNQTEDQKNPEPQGTTLSGFFSGPGNPVVPTEAPVQLEFRRTSVTQDYTLTARVLGFGINGKVLQCFCKKTRQKCALKVSSSLGRYALGSHDTGTSRLRMSKSSIRPVHHWSWSITGPCQSLVQEASDWSSCFILKARYQFLYNGIHRFRFLHWK